MSRLQNPSGSQGGYLLEVTGYWAKQWVANEIPSMATKERREYIKKTGYAFVFLVLLSVIFLFFVHVFLTPRSQRAKRETSDLATLRHSLRSLFASQIIYSGVLLLEISVHSY
jgi:hypothetical protein